jgi:phage baseplate assembly protein W
MSTTFPYATLTNIQSSSWELMLDSTAGGGAGSGLGQVCQALGDVHQTLQIIFSTIPGEDPFRPTFGCDLTQFLDRPLTAAIPAIVGAVSAAIATWEPRISVTNIDVTASTTNIGQLAVSITWQPNLGLINQANSVLGNLTQTTVIKVGGVS